ncbi:MAG: HAD hydrolase-like protein [Bacteroidales bacterium]
MTTPINTIIWDWNGTLLNDINICIEGINRLLQRRGIQSLELDQYRRIFTFPVKDYYLAAGFDLDREAFEVPALEFIHEYNGLLKEAALFSDVKSTLKYFRNQGTRQFIVSAMEQQALLRSVQAHGLSGYFEEICGIEDHLAHSKVHRGKALISKAAIDPAKSLFIGDTLHDHEVGTQLGVEVALISRGHQCHSRLKVNGNAVFEDLEELLAHLRGNRSIT